MTRLTRLLTANWIAASTLAVATIAVPGGTTTAADALPSMIELAPIADWATHGEVVPLLGALSSAGAPLADRTVTINVSVDGTSTYAFQVVTDLDGVFSVDDQPPPGSITFTAGFTDGAFIPSQASVSTVVYPRGTIEAGQPPDPPLTFPLELDDSLDASTEYTPIVPARLLDTRIGEPTIDGLGRPGRRLGPGAELDLQVLGRAGIPASGIAAVSLNVTAVLPSAASFLTVYPSGAQRPMASNVNFVPGQVVPNVVVAKLGTAGNVTIFNASGDLDVVVDVSGYYPSDDPYVPLVPARVLDTRPGEPTVDGLARPGRPIGPGGTLDVRVTGRGGVPLTGVDAVVLNMTATRPTAHSFLTVWPSGTERPVVSSLNMAPGQTVANAVVATVGTGGQISVYNLAGEVDVVADVAGYFPAGGTYVALQPFRVYDSRTEVTLPGLPFPVTFPLENGETRQLQIAGHGDVPDHGVSAVVLNVTAINPSVASFLTVWPTGFERPTTSNLNTVAGQPARPSAVIAPVGAGGRINVYNLAGGVHIAVDVVGYFLEETSTVRELEVTDTNGCVIDWLGRLECWGDLPQDGFPYPIGAPSRPHRVTDGPSVDLGLSERETCAIRPDATLWCWSAPNSANPLATPRHQLTMVATAIQVDGGGDRMCAVQADGQVWCWSAGSLDEPATAPMLVEGIDDAVGVTVGPSAVCAVRATGNVSCWGAGSTGILGDGSTEDSPNTAVEVDVGGDALWVHTGADRACATKEGGTVVCWGQSHLGDAFLDGSAFPVTVLDDAGRRFRDWTSVGAGDGFTCAATGTSARCWGRLGAAGFPSFPMSVDGFGPGVEIQGLPDAWYVGVAGEHACAVTSDDEVYCWGTNHSFQFAAAPESIGGIGPTSTRAVRVYPFSG